jgi:hypothetical protein
MKKILLSLGLLGLVATASVADVKMENVNLAEIQAGKFYDKSGVSINTLPVVFYDDFSFKNTNFMFMGQPHSSIGVQEGGHFMGEIGVTDSVSMYTDSITPSIFYGANLKTFVSDKMEVNIDEDISTKSDERYTDITLRVGHMFTFDKFSIIYGVEKGVLTGDVDFEKFAGVNVITNFGAIGMEVRKTDLGSVDTTTATISYSMSF